LTNSKNMQHFPSVGVGGPKTRFLKHGYSYKKKSCICCICCICCIFILYLLYF